MNYVQYDKDLELPYVLEKTHKSSRDMFGLDSLTAVVQQYYILHVCMTLCVYVVSTLDHSQILVCVVRAWLPDFFAPQSHNPPHHHHLQLKNPGPAPGFTLVLVT